MANSKKALSIVAYTLGGSDYLGVLKSFDFPVDITTDEGKTIAERYDKAVATKKSVTWSAEHEMKIAGAEITNLSVSVFSEGGNDLLAKLRSWDLDVSTKSKEGSGLAEVWKSPDATGTGFKLTSNNIIASSTLLVPQMVKAAQNGVSQLPVQVLFTAGSFNLSLACLLNTAGHKGDVDDLQELSLGWETRGTPTTVAGATLLQNILTGAAEITHVLNTGAGNYSGTSIIDSAKISVGDEKIVKESYRFSLEGALTLVSS